MGLLSTAVGGLLSVSGNAVGSIASVYWTSSSLSLYGMMIFMLLGLGIIYTIIVICVAAYLKDLSILLPHSVASQRRLCCGQLCRRSRRAGFGFHKLGSEDFDDHNESIRNQDIHEAGVGLLSSEQASASKVMVVDPEASIDPTTCFSSADTVGARVGPVWLSRLTQVELLIVMGLNNVFAATTQFYATPPSREPPLLQSILPCISMVAVIPFSKLLLGDRKQYWAKEPILAVLLVTSAVLTSVLPTVLDPASSSGASSSGAESSANTLAWSFVFFLSQVGTALAFTLQQAYLIRAGALLPGAPHSYTQITMLRSLMYNQLIVSGFLACLFWMDILPWWGSTAGGIDDWAAGVSFSFACSLFGPSSVHQSSLDGQTLVCNSSTPVYAFTFLLTYVAYLYGSMLVNTDSAVFTTALTVAQTFIVSIYWLIPGTDPNPSDTPLWSVVVAVLLSSVGIAILKNWESRTDTKDQFGLQALPIEAERVRRYLANAAATKAAIEVDDAGDHESALLALPSG